MTRINTNVSSLTAQQNLQRSNNQLQTALTRLSTGLRINSGKDDPAGMISAAQLGSEINSTNTAISNSKTAEQIIDTADSALSQVTSLLNDIRGLITQAANKGAMSPDQIAANQSQINSSLDAINRIAQTTNYQGLNLLDGSLGYQYKEGNTLYNNFSNNVKSLNINQATLGTAADMEVTVNVATAAQQAQLETSFPTAGAKAEYTTDLNAGTLTIQAPASGDTYNNMTVKFEEAATVGAKYDTDTNTLTIDVHDATSKSAGKSNGQTTLGDIKTALASTDIYTGGVKQTGHLGFVGSAGTMLDTAVMWDDAKDSPVNVAAVKASGEGASKDFGILRVTANTGGAAGNVTVQLAQGTAGTYDLTNGVLTIYADGTSGGTALSQVASDFDGAQNLFTATAVVDGTYVTGDNLESGFSVANGADAIAAAAPQQSITGTNTGFPQDVTFRLTGDKGSQVYTFSAGESLADIKNLINSQSDSTGVTANSLDDAQTGTTYLTFDSTDYGSNAKVAIDVINGGATIKGNMKDRAGKAALSATGTDVVATVNGMTAEGDGNSLSVATPVLSMDMQVAAAYTGNIGFTIQGGGAQFQLGSNINTNNQANFGIPSVDTGSLGGSAGLLYELAKDGDASLAKDPTTAASIVDQAVNQITSLRGRLGAFQKTTLETNISTLGDTVNALTNAQSTIQDADFASETANLTRAQILVQSGTAVLQIANRGPQQVLTLLQNL